MHNPFFKNMLIYRFSRDFNIDIDSLDKKLELFRFSPCGSQDMAKSGWFSPLVQYSDVLYHAVNNQLLLVIRREEKIIPKQTIADEINKKVSTLEQEQGRRLKKTEKDSIRDEVLHSLLPRAFTKNSLVRIWINTAAGFIVVDTSSIKRAEDSLALLRKTLGSLPVVPLTMENPIELTLTEWVRSEAAPSGFSIGDEAVLKAILEDGGTGQFKKQDLACDEILTHIEAGKVVTQISIEWQQRISFTLSCVGILKRVKFADQLISQNDDIDREDVVQRFDADIMLMTGELSNLISDLTAALGGEAKR
ncbi:recombination-associated protein RdgC [Salmonella enterica]|nr:recombination-associated protein RdgC [Salmonella enterica]EDF3585178.1 recombination-associated protein RdgC [Salmonella enterica subsp. enterica serovar Poona]EFQ6973850.1 recombination-associated protein RdgC [Salmonella enterica]EIB1034298.1 recombination-associated protein RdgC [Salmonella enterica]EJG6879805.1 recombination-associated protein RdgC [Salmonella enterica]